MRTLEDIARFQADADRRLEALRQQEKKLAKDKSSRGRLARLDTQVRRLQDQEGRVRLDREEAQLKLKALEDEYAEAVAREGINVDGSAPPGSKQAEIAAQITHAREKLSSDLWEARLRGLVQARRSAEADRDRFASDNFDDLAEELKEEGGAIAKDLRDVRARVAVLEERWAEQSRAWLHLERASGGQGVRGRLDVPEFPIKIEDSVERPVPRALEELTDQPVAEAPIVFAGA